MRVRGTAQQIIEKYLSLARDAASSGDRVGSENFLQHADHYQRMLNEIAGSRAEGSRPEGGRPEGGRPEGGRPDNGSRLSRRPNGQDDEQPSFDADQEQPDVETEEKPAEKSSEKSSGKATSGGRTSTRKKRTSSEGGEDVPSAVNA